jgi:hypothetical protein
VAMAHAVPTSTRSELADERQPKEHKGRKWVYAEKGDLALEIVARKTGKVLGYSYLSGPALQLNHYKPLPAWYDDAGDVSLIEIPHPEGEPRAFVEDIIGRLMKAKYSENKLVFAFKHQCRERDDPRHVAEALCDYASYEDKSRKPTAHILGVVIGHKRGPKGAVTLHFQPPRDSAECHATSFQTELAITAAEWARTEV